MITHFLRRHPGAGTEQIGDHRWSIVPPESRREFVQSLVSELERLKRYGVIEYREGWHNTDCPDPFIGPNVGGACMSSVVRRFQFA
jgi:hypothetical protein